MSSLEFTSSLVSSLAWPLVVLLVVVILREPLVNLLSNLTKLKYNNLEMDFSEKLDELESNLAGKVLTNNGPLRPNKEKEITSVAKISPAASISMSWSYLEQEIMTAMKRMPSSGEIPKHNSAMKNISYLMENGYIDLETYGTLNDLRSIRNKAVHIQQIDSNINYTDAIKFFDLTKQLIGIIRSIGR